jgi:hypothetical protein
MIMAPADGPEGRDPERPPGVPGARRPGTEPRHLREVRAAQLRAVATRWALGRMALGLLFLVGAMSYSLGPDPHAQMSALWMALLVILSTVHLGLGLRALSRVRRWGRRLWWVATGLFGVLATIMLRIASNR